MPIVTTGSRTTPSPVNGAAPPLLKRFTLDEYHRIIEHGILASGAPFELLNGWIIQKMTISPPHASAVGRTTRRLLMVLPTDLVLRVQQPISIPATDSEPEPDVAVAKGPESRYDSRHPTPRDVLLLAEVADSSILLDQGEKLIAYARARVPVYWIVNLEARRVEVYTDPRGGRTPTYRTRTDYAPGTAVPVVIAGGMVGSIPAGELLP